MVSEALMYRHHPLIKKLLLLSANQQKEILTPAALEFAANLHQTFNSNRLDLLKQREIRQSEIDDGHMPDFLTETEPIRQGEWKNQNARPSEILPSRFSRLSCFDGIHCSDFSLPA